MVVRMNLVPNQYGPRFEFSLIYELAPGKYKYQDSCSRCLCFQLGRRYGTLGYSFLHVKSS